MSNAQAIKEIDLNIKQAQGFVELGKSLERLRSNRDFKAVILEGYLEKESIRLVHLKSDPSMQTEERQTSIVKQIDAIGLLNHYFNTVYQQAIFAGRAIEADEETREELLAEDVANV